MLHIEDINNSNAVFKEINREEAQKVLPVVTGEHDAQFCDIYTNFKGHMYHICLFEGEIHRIYTFPNGQIRVSPIEKEAKLYHIAI